METEDDLQRGAVKRSSWAEKRSLNSTTMGAKLATILRVGPDLHFFYGGSSAEQLGLTGY